MSAKTQKVTPAKQPQTLDEAFIDVNDELLQMFL